MGWSLGHDTNWDRFIGYGVPAYCDHPDCDAEIDRGLAYVCCEQQPYGGEHGCGLYFCEEHRRSWIAFDPEDVNEEGDGTHGCERCAMIDGEGNRAEPFEPKPEHPRWISHLLNDPSWAKWRGENRKMVKKLKAALVAR